MTPEIGPKGPDRARDRFGRGVVVFPRHALHGGHDLLALDARLPLAAVRSLIPTAARAARTWVALQRETRPWMRLRCLLGVEYALRIHVSATSRVPSEVAIRPFDEVG